VINRLINTLGPKIGCAYNVGCAFNTTLNGTSLKDLAKTNDFRLMVGAFHGHAHNRLCQLRWHPTYIEGTGNTEGEGCEHVFSSSNDLARGTRHATRFHRHQAIEEHFTFWDEDKYANLSNSFLSHPFVYSFLFVGQFFGNHYRAALKTIRTLESELSRFALSPKDFQQHFEQEKKYLEGLKQPSPNVSRKARYVQALNELREYKSEVSFISTFLFY
jgi:hypothetical protein